MCSVVKSGVKAHDDACLTALNTYQASVAGNPSQATVNSAVLTFHRAVVASGKANNGGNGIGPSLDAIRSLGFNA